jgi:hypothetical protein
MGLLHLRVLADFSLRKNLHINSQRFRTPTGASTMLKKPELVTIFQALPDLWDTPEW